MTTVNFTLSQQLINSLTKGGGGNGVYAYAFAFSGSNPITTHATLVKNGVTQDTSITLPSDFPSGNIYVVIEQAGQGKPSSFTSIDSMVIGDINPDNASANNYTYQLFEATLSSNPGAAVFDQADISSLNTFGIASTLEVLYSDGSTDSRGFNVSAADIFSAIGSENVQTYNPNIFSSGSRLGIGPATANNSGGFPAADWEAYVKAFKNNQTVLDDIQIVTTFTGSQMQPGAMLSEYGVKYVAHDSYGDDYFWLVPNTKNGANNTDWIQITAQELMENIYVQTGQLKVYASDASGNPTGSPTTYGSFTPNNAVGTVVRNFVAGFDAGYWGATVSSPNPLVTETINLNHTSNWSFIYAYGATLYPDLIHYTNVLGSGPGTVGGNNRFYDPWAQAVAINSNSYGYSYSDQISSGGINPQISLWDTGTNADVSQINITLYDTNETPSSGFRESPISYVAPPAGGYKDNLTNSNNQIGFAFNFSILDVSYVPDKHTSSIFRFYAPSSAQADTDGFVSLKVSGSDGSWYYYQLQENAGQWTLEATNPYGGGGGGFNIQNVPVTADGSVSWYQLIFGEGDTETIYNIYATSDENNHFSSMVVDHTAQVTANPAINYYGINFAPGGSITYNIDTLSPPSTDNGDSPAVISISAKTQVLHHAPALDADGVPVATQGIAGVIDEIQSAYSTRIGENAENLVLTGADNVNAWDNGDNNVIYGNAGHNVIRLSGGNDVVDGGSGYDRLVLPGSRDAYDISIQSGIAIIRNKETAETIKTADIQTVSFGGQTASPIDGLYEAYLGRASSGEEYAAGAARLDHGATLDDLAHDLAASSESAAHLAAGSNADFITTLYATVLTREPDEDGLGYWVGQLASGELTREQVALNFAVSSEYQSSYIPLFSTNQSDIAGLYRALLDRNPDDDGFAWYLEKSANGENFGLIAQSIAHSEEFAARVTSESPEQILADLYTGLLKRNADPDGIAYWEGKLGEGTDIADIAVSFVASNEFQTNTDRLLVRNDWLDLLSSYA